MISSFSVVYGSMYLVNQEIFVVFLGNTTKWADTAGGEPGYQQEKWKHLQRSNMFAAQKKFRIMYIINTFRTFSQRWLYQRLRHLYAQHFLFVITSRVCRLVIFS